MTILLCAMIGLVVVAIVVTIYAVMHAPDGFEDESGFHSVGPIPRANSSTSKTLSGQDEPEAQFMPDVAHGYDGGPLAKPVWISRA